MTWTDPENYSTGQLISAIIWNELLGASGNLASHTAGGVITDAGDTIYGTGNNAVSRLAKGTARQNLTINSGATAPEWTASPASLMTAKADVLSTSAANTPARLAVGANDTVLTADSGESTGLKWAAAGGGGKILQVVSATATAEVTNNTNTYATTGLSAAITPASSSNHVVCIFEVNVYRASADNFIGIRVTRAISGGATSAVPAANIIDMLGYTSDLSIRFTGQGGGAFKDSPSTTSACTYTAEFKSTENSATVRVNQFDSGATCTMTLMEVDGT